MAERTGAELTHGLSRPRNLRRPARRPGPGSCRDQAISPRHSPVSSQHVERYEESFLPAITSAVDLRGDPRAMVALGDREVVAGLQVHPELGAGAEMVREAQRASALIARLPFRIDVIRPEGTRSARASRLAECRVPRARASGCGQGESGPSELIPCGSRRSRRHGRHRARNESRCARAPAVPSSYSLRVRACPRPDHPVRKRSTLKLAGCGFARCLWKRPCGPAKAGTAFRRPCPASAPIAAPVKDARRRAGSAGRRSLTGAAIGARYV